MIRSRVLVPAFLLVASVAGAQVQQPPNLRPGEEDPKALQAQKVLKEGQRLMAAEDVEGAAKAFEEAIALDPLLMMAHYGLGTARMARKEYAAAATAFEAARQAFHDRMERDAGLRHRSQANREERMRKLREAIRKMPEASGPGAGGVVNMQRGEWEAELRMLEAAERSESGPPAVPAGLSLSLGSAYFRSGRIADAEREYRAALAAQPNLGEAHINLAVVLLMTGKPADAKEEIKLAKKARAKVPPGLEKDIDDAIAKAKAS